MFIKNVKSNLLKNFIYSQLLLLFFLFICFIIKPEILLNNEGISAFGIDIKTIVPYAIGYLLCSYFIGKSVKYMKHNSNPYKIIFYSMNTIAILFIALVFTPYAINTGFNWIHTIISTSLFLTELGLIIYLTIITKNNFINILLIIGQIISGIIAMYSIYPILPITGKLNFLLQGEVLFQTFFDIGIIIIFLKYKITEVT